MNKINLHVTSERVMELLRTEGYSEKMIAAYQSTGFSAITKHFSQENVVMVDEKMLEEFLSVQWHSFERGEFSQWTWRILRRSCELLKHCSLTDTVLLPPLRPWDFVLGRPRQMLGHDTPTEKQLADSKDIFALSWKVYEAMQQSGLRPNTIRHYTVEGLTVLLNRHYEQGTEHYSGILISEVVQEKRAKYEQKETSRVSYQNLRKAAWWLDEMYRTGRISFECLPDWSLRIPLPQFQEYLQLFCVYMEENGFLKKTSVLTMKSAVRNFLFALEANGFDTFEAITPGTISDCITQMAVRYPKGFQGAAYSIRTFLRFLYNNGITSVDHSISIPEQCAHRRTFRKGFSSGELKLLLATPDTETPLGKRDYAMMMLAVQTGLRACDIVKLQRDSIDWRRKELCLIQQKTGKPLQLPLASESCRAVADYLLYGRPESNLPYLFLCHSGIPRPLNSRSASGTISGYMKKAGIPSADSRRGFHSFRRTFGTNLLQNEVPIELLQQMLGHTAMDSTKPYLSVDEQGLKWCALSLADVKKAGDRE